MLKQVIVVRKDLNMRKGKMIAQAGHAVEHTWLKEGKIVDGKLVIELDEHKTKWLQEDLHTKICVSVDSEAALIEIHEKAKALNLPTVMIEDYGLTEFKGQKTLTVVSIGPAPADLIDQVTKTLPLL